jgi:hypothetical protein
MDVMTVDQAQQRTAAHHPNDVSDYTFNKEMLCVTIDGYYHVRPLHAQPSDNFRSLVAPAGLMARTSEVTGQGSKKLLRVFAAAHPAGTRPHRQLSTESRSDMVVRPGCAESRSHSRLLFC